MNGYFFCALCRKKSNREQEKLKKYTVLRIEETELLIMAQDSTTESNTNAIDEVRIKINEVLKENKQ